MIIKFVKEELEAKLKQYEEENWTEQDAIMDLYQQGYTADSFRYDPERYKWAKKMATKYGML